MTSQNHIFFTLGRRALLLRQNLDKYRPHFDGHTQYPKYIPTATRKGKRQGAIIAMTAVR